MLHRKRCGLFIVYLFSQVEFKIVLLFINSVTGFDLTNLIIWQILRSVETIRSLSNSEGDGYENVTLKSEVALLQT